MANIKQFVAVIKAEGLAVTNRFEVTFMPPAGLLSPTNPNALEYGRMEKILMMCESINLPGLNLSTNPTRTFGEVRETPYEKLYEPVTMRFYVDRKLNVKKIFDEWLSLIQSRDNRQFEFYDNYISDINITVLDKKDQPVYNLKLFEAYPKTISSIELDNNNKDLMRFTVTFMYKYWINDANSL